MLVYLDLIMLDLNLRKFKVRQDSFKENFHASIIIEEAFSCFGGIRTEISNLRKFITGQASLKKYELDVKRDSDDDDDDLIVH